MQADGLLLLYSLVFVIYNSGIFPPVVNPMFLPILAGMRSLWLLLLIPAILSLGLAVLGFLTWYQRVKLFQAHPNRRRQPPFPRRAVLFGAVALVLLVVSLCGACERQEEVSAPTVPETTAATEPVETQPVSLWQPAAVDRTAPQSWPIQWEIWNGDQPLSEYNRDAPIYFGDPADYFSLPGIATFRGNNYRNSGAFGTADIQREQMEILWDAATRELPGASWSGSGWTGQPLIVQWDAATRSHMDLLPEKKEKEDLTEVIYATLDGHIYFLDLEDGAPTREPLNIGLCFKGSGSLDPRGYPLMYVGAGDVNSQGQRPRMYIISLIDRQILYTYGDSDPLSQRTDNNSWCAFDSAPLVDARTDTLIWPGENGLLYTIRLNTQYDKSAGTLSVAPEAPVRTRYSTPRSNAENYWLGYEASAAIVENYLYVSENGGMFYCVDLNTMELVWAQDTKDDSNASPVFERVSETEGYIYTAPSLHWTKDNENHGTISVFKLNAVTGEILWETPFSVYTQEGVSGGMQSTALLGKPGTSLEGMLIVSISRTPNEGTGILVALDTSTGEEIWRYTLDYYAWSTPTAVYTESGTGYVLLADSGGTLHLLAGDTGEKLHSLRLNGLVEATPAVFNDILIIGTREKKVYGIRLS